MKRQASFVAGPLRPTRCARRSRSRADVLDIEHKEPLGEAVKMSCRVFYAQFLSLHVVDVYPHDSINSCTDFRLSLQCCRVVPCISMNSSGL